jgi:hypothetical protein
VTPAHSSDAAELDGLDWLVDHVGETPGEDDAASYGIVAEALGLAPDAPRRKVLARFRGSGNPRENLDVAERLRDGDAKTVTAALSRIPDGAIPQS